MSAGTVNLVERMVEMYNKGQHVVYGNKGVCTVEDITTLNIPGVDREKLYYILKPLYISSSTVYVPVESGESSLRSVLSRQEAEDFICSIPRISLIQIVNEKLVEQEYRSCMRSNDCRELVRVIKTIYGRKTKRLKAGRKETAVDSKYFKLAEDNLYGELAVSLDMPRAEVGGYILRRLQEGAAAQEAGPEAALL